MISPHQDTSHEWPKLDSSLESIPVVDALWLVHSSHCIIRASRRKTRHLQVMFSRGKSSQLRSLIQGYFKDTLKACFQVAPAVFFMNPQFISLKDIWYQPYESLKYDNASTLNICNGVTSCSSRCLHSGVLDVHLQDIGLNLQILGASLHMLGVEF